MARSDLFNVTKLYTMLRPNSVYTRRKLSVGFLVIVALLLLLQITFHLPKGFSETRGRPHRLATSGGQSTRPLTRTLAKVSMIYGQENTLYKRALQSHQRHCTRWNHQMFVLRQEMFTGYWNKPNYLISLILQELAKPAEQRIEWLMWVDADSIILNPAIPPDIFLPPSEMDDIHFVGTKDHNGLNTGIMFLRVHPWTVNMLVESVANPLFFPDIDLGWSADQTSMALILAKQTGGFDGTGYKSHGIYMPRRLFNAYEFGHGFEGSAGDFLVHFPGLGSTRWERMAQWLDIVEGERAGEWEVDVEASGYRNSTGAFWTVVKEVRRGLRDVERALNSSLVEPDGVQAAVEELKRVLWEEADDVDQMRTKLGELMSRVILK